MNDLNLLYIGSSTSSHGIKGEFSLKLINEHSRILISGMAIFIESGENKLVAKHIIESIRYGNKTIIKFKGIDSKTLSDSMLPIKIFIDKIHLPKLDKEEFYIVNLMGSKVYNIENNKYVGEVFAYYENKVQTIIQIKNDIKVIDVVFNNVFIKEVDEENKIIKIVLPEEIE